MKIMNKEYRKEKIMRIECMIDYLADKIKVSSRSDREREYLEKTYPLLINKCKEKLKELSQTNLPQEIIGAFVTGNLKEIHAFEDSQVETRIDWSFPSNKENDSPVRYEIKRNESALCGASLPLKIDDWVYTDSPINCPKCKKLLKEISTNNK